MSIEVADLSILRSINVPEGFPVQEVKAPQGVGRGFRCLFREFASPSNEIASNVRALVNFRGQLTAEERATLDASFLWPLELVESAGTPIGYLTGVVHSRFEERVRTPYSGETTVARTLDWLIRPGHAHDVGASVVVGPDNIIVRSTYCAQIARALHFLHSRGIVFGDIGPLRAVASDSPIDVLLIGSEFVRAADSSWQEPGIHSPGMTPPEIARGQSVQNIGTDLFKLALLFRDILGAGGLNTSPLSPLSGRIDHDGIDMFERGLGQDPELRPSAVDWYTFLYSQTVSHSLPPAIDMFGAVPEHGIRNQSIEFTWDAHGHRALTLETPWGEVQELDVSASRHRLTLKQSGQFRLIASNPHGTTERSSAIVYAFDPPGVRFVEVPELGGVAQAMTGIDSAALSDTVLEGVEFTWLGGGFDAVASPQLPPLPDLPQFGAAGVALEQVDWEGLTSVINDAMAAADAEVRGGSGTGDDLRESAAALVSRARSLASTVASGRPRVRTRRRNSRRRSGEVQ
ncbi:hypothetical protein [Rhodococcus sp. IEGM 1379]|uniref:hypothetical protein n=1 Tax=Rhodococcus sp. IEGM 1379 TaxID=3047086 RepID=UPI0024B821AC|nr:hypothetical protein [Rhodococcus sp. IEGM 1379]MDI9916340.1 hypothetical protein [Rhodococcus sp. IEGM 1379]